MSTCGGNATLVGTAKDASNTTEIKHGKAVYVSKKDDTILKFKSFSEKYAYMRGKFACTGSSYGC
jgi:hypothetical protein